MLDVLTIAIQVPAFLPAECFLVYGGSVNAYHNNLRTRSLLSFIAVVLQIPCGVGLQYILDHEACKLAAMSKLDELARLTILTQGDVRPGLSLD